MGWGGALTFLKYRPPSEINRFDNISGFVNNDYGYPFCYGDDDIDPTFNTDGNCDPYQVCSSWDSVQGLVSLQLTFAAAQLAPSSQCSTNWTPRLQR